MVAAKVTLHGPIFRKGVPEKVLRAAIKDTLQDVVERGEQIVRAQLFPGHGLVTGNYRRSIAGEVGIQIGRGKGTRNISSSQRSHSLQGIRRDSLHAIIWDSGVVYGPWLEGVSSRNERSRFKGYGMFRKTNAALNIAAPRLLQKHINRAMKRLGGV